MGDGIMYRITILVELNDGDVTFNQSPEELVAEENNVVFHHKSYSNAVEAYSRLEKDERVYSIKLERFELEKMSKDDLVLSLLNGVGYIQSGSVVTVKEKENSGTNSYTEDGKLLLNL